MLTGHSGIYHTQSLGNRRRKIHVSNKVWSHGASGRALAWYAQGPPQACLGLSHLEFNEFCDSKQADTVWTLKQSWLGPPSLAGVLLQLHPLHGFPKTPMGCTKELGLAQGSSPKVPEESPVVVKVSLLTPSIYVHS